MEFLFQKIQKIINDEVLDINLKIKGTAFLEIMKFRIIEKISEIKDLKLKENKNKINLENSFENDDLKLKIKLFSSDAEKIYLNSKLQNDLLLICLFNTIKIDMKDFITNKYNIINLIPNTGITLPLNADCKISVFKKTLLLELYYEDKKLHIENTIKEKI